MSVEFKVYELYTHQLYTYKPFLISPKTAMQIIDSANEIKERAVDVFDYATEYLEARWNLGVLNASEKTAITLSSLVAGVIVGIFGIIVLLFLSLGVAWMIGEKMDNHAAGFFLVGGFYAIVGIILYNIRDKFIKVPLVNAFIKNLYYEN
jgi:hypothetical protein